MGEGDLEDYQCLGCGRSLTDETAFLDVEDHDAPYCEECFYKYPSGPFFGEYDENYDRDHPTEKQRFCIRCQKCCKGCWYLAPAEGCVIYPHRPNYCRGYECAKLRAEVA